MTASSSPAAQSLARLLLAGQLALAGLLPASAAENGTFTIVQSCGGRQFFSTSQIGGDFGFATVDLYGNYCTSSGSSGSSGAVYGPDAIGAAPTKAPLLTGFADANGNVQKVAPGTPLPVSDSQSAPFTSDTAMTVGTAYTAGRSIGVAATASGNVTITMQSGSSITVPVTPGWQTFPFAATTIATTTATATYYELN